MGKAYQAPSIVAAGDFTELTQAVRDGGVVDFVGGWWF